MEAAFVFLIVASAAYALACGNAGAFGEAALAGASRSVELCVALAGGYMFWSGVIAAADRGGLTDKLLKALRPLLKALFPDTRGEALNRVGVNITANMLGMGNAATPAGLEAMRLMAGPGDATADRIMFVIINISSVQLVPTGPMTVLAQAGAPNPGVIIVPSLIATAASTAAGVLSVMLFRRFVK